jgi:hypothetical protein
MSMAGTRTQKLLLGLQGLSPHRKIRRVSLSTGEAAPWVSAELGVNEPRLTNQIQSAVEASGTVLCRLSVDKGR